jgi:carboxylate-amine ligase
LDLERREPYPAAGAVQRLLEWTAPVRSELGIDVALPSLNGAQRQRRMLDSGMTLREVYAAVQAQTRETYSLGHPATVARRGR